MQFDDLFEQRILIASKLKQCIKEMGFTKASFARQIGISRPTLDKLLAGNVSNKTRFDEYMHRILPELQLTAEELMFFSIPPKEKAENPPQNIPEAYQMNEKALKQYDLLMDIVDLCTIYY